MNLKLTCNSLMLVVVLGICVVTGGCSKKIERNSSYPDILILLVDALRADHLPTYGYPLNTAPFFSKWAENGVIFENVISQSSWTKSSIASLLTSTYPSVHGVFTSPELDNPDRFFDEKDILSPHAVTLAEILSRKNYQTGGFSTNHHISPLTGFQQGFDLLKVVDVEYVIHKPWGNQVNDAFLKWAKHLKADKPFFAYLHYMDVHGPYTPPSPYKETFLDFHKSRPVRTLTDEEYKKLRYLKLDTKVLNEYMALYDAQILYWDSFFAQLWARIVAMGLDKNLMVIVIADHGEAFFEHGYCDHGYGLHIEELHVPMVFYMPNRLSGKRVKETVALFDVAPTILEMLGIDKPKTWEGESLWGLLQGHEPKARRIFSELDIPVRGRYVSFIENTKHWIYNLEDESLEFVYDLENDPKESNNLLDKLGESQRWEVEKFFRTWLAEERGKRIPPPVVRPNIKLNKRDLQSLQALGYVNE